MLLRPHRFTAGNMTNDIKWVCGQPVAEETSSLPSAPFAKASPATAPGNTNTATGVGARDRLAGRAAACRPRRPPPEPARASVSSPRCDRMGGTRRWGSRRVRAESRASSKRWQPPRVCRRSGLRGMSREAGGRRQVAAARRRRAVFKAGSVMPLGHSARGRRRPCRSVGLDNQERSPCSLFALEQAELDHALRWRV